MMIDSAFARRFPRSVWTVATLLMTALAGQPAIAAQADASPQAPSTSTATSPTVDAALLRQYRSHVEFLANPFMEGRGPGTRGNQIAAEYIEAWMRSAGLKPGFADAGDGSFRQPFIAGTQARRTDSVLSSGEAKLTPDVDYAVLGISAAAEVTAPLAFVGYSIPKGGPDGEYSSYPAGAEKPLEGKIAVMFRFEPMNDDGKSLWRKASDGSWTAAAAIAEKVRAATSRGAVGIILVSPPGCADPRTRKLESTEGSARWMRALDVPVFMMTPEAAGRLIAGRDPQRRDLMQLRHLADTTPELVDLGGAPVTMSAKIDRSPRTTWNVAATLPGRGPLADQFIVVGAHYDHVGYGYTGGSRTDEYGVVHPGADDNASGTAGLILAAEQLKRRFEGSEADRRSIVFVGFSAEEMGLIGSREYVKTGPLTSAQTYAMLNMDMIGRLRDDAIEIAGSGTAEGFEDLIRPDVARSGLKATFSPGGRGPSDHASFYAAGVPVLHVFTGLHEQYHTPRDTTDTINFEGGVRSAMLVVDIAERLATRPEPLTFKSTDRRPRGGERDPAAAGPGMGGVKVRFGISPGNYADGEAGVVVGEVNAGTSAEEAGIKAGDRLIRWNGKEIADVAGWMEMLAEHKPGDVVDVIVKRNGEDVTTRVTLKSRDQTQR